MLTEAVGGLIYGAMLATGAIAVESVWRRYKRQRHATLGDALRRRIRRTEARLLALERKLPR